MEKRLKEKISSLDPKVRRKIEDLFKNMSESISILYDIATQDEKTGLYNSRFFSSHLDAEIERVKRGSQKLCLMILDIDDFKKINDVHGHIKADDLLFRLASVIKKQIRKSDMAARFGGEEFMILLPETSLNKARKFATRLQNKIISDPILEKYNMRISGGATQFKNKDTKKTFKTRADKALYQAKKTGKNKIVFLK